MAYLIPLLFLPLLFVSFYRFADWGECSFRRVMARREEEILSLLDDQLLFLSRRDVTLVQTGSTLLFFTLFTLISSGQSLPLFLVFSASGGLAGFIFPLLAVRFWIGLRKRKIERQIPDFLKFLSGAVKAGASVSEAIRQGARELPSPLSNELELMRKNIRMGKSFEEALLLFRERVNLEEVRLVVSALVLSNMAGGALTGTLERLEKTLEERQRIRGKVAALTAQGKMQGWIVGAIPLILGGFLSLFDPGLMAPFWTTLPGAIALLSVLFLEAAGFYMIRKIVREEA